MVNVAGAPHSPLILSGSHDGLIVHWNPINGDMDNMKSTSVQPHKNQVQTIRFDVASNIVVSCGLDDTLKFMDINLFNYV